MAEVLLPLRTPSREPISTGSVATQGISTGLSNNNNSQDAFLKNKITGSLRDLGYGEMEVSRVAALVSVNTFTCPQFDLEINLRSGIQAPMNEIVESVLYHSLGAVKPLINSNEVVFMLQVNDMHTFSGHDVERLKNEFIFQLRSFWGIKPVRVYIADCGALEKTGRFYPFRYTILNVVNTDIGGPSMVQLLDHGYETANWSHMVVSQEAYREYEFLWRSEKTWNVKKESQQNTESDSMSAHEPDVVMVENSEVSKYPNDLTSSVVEIDKLEAESDDDFPEGNHHSTDLASASNISVKDDIVHPTWDHIDDSATLIDLVKMQASGVSITSDEPEMVDSEKTEKPAKKDSARATFETGDEVDFEFV